MMWVKLLVEPNDMLRERFTGVAAEVGVEQQIPAGCWHASQVLVQVMFKSSAVLCKSEAVRKQSCQIRSIQMAVNRSRLYFKLQYFTKKESMVCVSGRFGAAFLQIVSSIWFNDSLNVLIFIHRVKPTRKCLIGPNCESKWNHCSYNLGIFLRWSTFRFGSV